MHNCFCLEEKLLVLFMFIKLVFISKHWLTEFVVFYLKMFANLSKNIDISPFTIKHKDWILSFWIVSILLSFCVVICSSWSMWVNYGCDVIKEVKVWCWWRQTIITCPFRHRISVENIMLLVTKHKYMSFIIHVGRFIWSSSWPRHLALSDLAMVKKY